MFTLNDCHFGYRESIFKKEYKGRFIILNVTFRLNRTPVFHTEYGAIREEMDCPSTDHPGHRSGGHPYPLHQTPRSCPNRQCRQLLQKSHHPQHPIRHTAKRMFQASSATPTPGPFALLSSAEPGSSPATTKLAARLASSEQCGWKGYRRGDAGCHARQSPRPRQLWPRHRQGDL